MADSPYLIVGLGNPGPEYANTRHNIGFWVIDELAKRWTDVRFAKKFQAQTAQVNRGLDKVLLMMPQTYMNLSGNAVGEALSFYKIDSENRLLVVYDDLDLPTGALRIRQSGGSGGHNGMKSIIGVVGEGFPRVRIGIGRQAGVVGHVLGKVSKNEAAVLKETVSKAADAVEAYLDKGILTAMNLFNSRGKDES
jgi:PTH1 family peptidyl-tRNA hydrolase